MRKKKKKEKSLFLRGNIGGTETGTDGPGGPCVVRILLCARCVRGLCTSSLPPSVERRTGIDTSKRDEKRDREERFPRTMLERWKRKRETNKRNKTRRRRTEMGGAGWGKWWICFTFHGGAIVPYYPAWLVDDAGKLPRGVPIIPRHNSLIREPAWVSLSRPTNVAALHPLATCPTSLLFSLLSFLFLSPPSLCIYLVQRAYNARCTSIYGSKALSPRWTPESVADLLWNLYS